MAYVKIDDFICEHYGRHWILKQPDRLEHKVRPKCKSYLWNTPQQRQTKGNPYRNDPALDRKTA